MKLLDLKIDLLYSIREADCFPDIDFSICKTMKILIDNNLFNWQILVFLENIEQKLHSYTSESLNEQEMENVNYAIEKLAMFRKVVQLKTFSLS